MWATYSAVRDLAVYKGDALPHSKMDFMMLKKVEHECATKSFEEGTAQYPQFRAQLLLYPSDVILTTLKQDLIKILQNQ